MSDRPERYVSKRVKVKTVPFELDESINSYKHKNVGGSGEAKALLYRRSEFLAVRNDQDDFFVCRAMQHVYETNQKHFKIQWLEQDSQDENTYELAYVDQLDVECILTNVRMQKVDKDKYLLPPNQRQKAEKILSKSVKGKDSSEGEDEEESEDEEEPPRKKAKLDSYSKKPKKGSKKSVRKTRKGILSKRGSLRKKTSSAVTAARTVRRRALGKTNGTGIKTTRKLENKMAESAGKRKTGNKKGALIPRPSIKVLEKDPLMSSKEKVPFISTWAHSKLVLRAALQNDVKLLKELIEDRDHVAKLDVVHNDGSEMSPLQIALKHENLTAVQLLCKQLFIKGKAPPKRVAVTSSLLKMESTGRYNRLSLHGVPFVRKLNLSRGSKEGNNAFTKDLDMVDRVESIIECITQAIFNGVSKATLDKFCAMAPNPSEAKQICYDNVYLAVQGGHRKLAAALMDDVAKTGLTTFNFLHHDVLAFDKEELRTGIRDVSVKKRPFNNLKITPLHCAAINPNPKYLTKLLAILPDFNIMDSSRGRLMHYAVACEGTGPLEWLLERGVNSVEVDSKGITPLMSACFSRRPHNVELLLRKAKQDGEKPVSPKFKGKSNNEDEEEPEAVDKFGLGGINMGVTRPGSEWFSYTALHIAAHLGLTEIARVLLQYGADINKELLASKNKLTPFMVAANYGQIEILRLLVKHGVKISQRDKLKRTPMMLAAMNGHAHVISLLLSLGCKHDDQDSSGNAALHYACGYGWYFCVKVLLDAGANPNVSNDWKTTPMAVAFLKGHIGLADILLEQASVDINFRLDNGLTLVHTACASALEEGIVEQLEYLVIKKHADCTLIDDSNTNALHHLAKNNICLEYQNSDFVPCKLAMGRSVKMADILIQHGCDVSAKDADGMTPLMLSIQQGNQMLVEFLVKNGAGISSSVDKENRNILHFLSEQCMKQSMAEILTMLQKNSGASGMLSEMGKQVDSNGMVPLIRACLQYRLWDGEFRAASSGFNANDFDKYYTDEERKEEKDSDSEEKNLEDESEKEEMQEDAEDDEHEDEVEEEENAEEKKDDEVLEMVVDEEDEQKDENSDQETPTKSSPKLPKKPESKAERQAVQWQDGRNYICKLLVACDIGADIPLQKKLFKTTDVIPDKEEDQYFHKSVAGLSAVHLLIGVKHELPLSSSPSSISPGGISEAADPCPGLSSFLKCISNKSDAELYNCFGRTPLLQAVAGKHERAAQRLIELGVDVNAKSRDKETDGLATPLILAARHGLHELIPLLLQHGANVNEKDSNNLYTALHYVVQKPVAKCFKSVVELLLTHKASVTEADKFQKTVLHLLMEHSRDLNDAVVVAGLLLGAGAFIDACDRKGRTPLHLAVNANSGDANCSTEMEQFLLDKGANQFARDWLQRLPLHYVFVKIRKHTNVSSLDPVELCSTLTSSTNKPGSMVNYGDQFGLTPLHVAARRGAGVCCIQLIKKGSNVNGRDFDGNTPLSLAIANKHESCTILLLQQNADISGNIVIIPEPKKVDSDNNSTDDTSEKKEKNEKKEKPEWKWRHLNPAERAQEIKTFSIFQGVISQEWQGVIFLMLDLLDKFSLNLLSVVQAALLTQKYHLALTLIRKVRGKNELTSKMEYDQNLAHVLAKSSEAKFADHLITVVAQLLLDKGVSFNLEDEYGCTPMHYACLQGNKPLVTFILGCCKNIKLEKKDKLGRTPMAAAFWKLAQNGKLVLEVVKILCEQGATMDLLCAYPGQQMYMFGHKQTLEAEDYLRSSTSNALISPLMLSICHHDFNLTRRLIELGANVNFSDIEGRTPLMLAVYENNVHLVRLLLDHQYVISADDEDESSAELEFVNKPHKQRKVFALGRHHKALPGIQKKIVQNKATGAKSQIIIVNGLNMSSKMYAKTSAMNEKALDCHGRSALHYLVHALPNGSYDNYRLLQQLVSVGAPLQQADKDGKTVMDYAVAQGLNKLATTIQYLLDREKVKSVTPKYAKTSVSDGITWDNPAPDFISDSEKFIEKFEKDLAEEEGKTEIEYKAVPDHNLAEFATGHVLIDTNLNVPYDVLLTKIDVGTGQWGLYNFYKMQIVHQKGKNLFILFTRWGRIGDTGQFQRTPFPQIDDAVKEFHKIFRSKTGNEWHQMKSFENKPRKYRLVPLEQRNFGRKSIDISINLKSNTPSKLHPYVQDLIEELTDMAMLASSMDRLGIDRSLVPLGRIKKETLLKAKDILVKLKSLVKSVENIRTKLPIGDMAKYEENLQEIAKLTNEYYHLLPKTGCEYELIPILDQHYLLQQEWEKIEKLMELEIATKIVIGTQMALKAMHPFDYIYRCMRCQIQLMDEKETEAQYLLRYVNATWKGKVEAIFHIAREGEEQRLASCGVDNHRLLFHGSSSSNLISILSKGLLIAPADAPGCGNAFGNGIYTADRFLKSLGYCFNYSMNSKVKFMLVCEVALGKTKDICNYEYQERVPEGFKSVRGFGRNQPDPQFDLTLPTGTVVPLGDNKEIKQLGNQSVWLPDSEYIVYKESQVCLRYIIQFIS